MLRRADNILNALEDPQDTRTNGTPTDDTQDDVTPVLAAQVYVPNVTNAATSEVLAAAVSSIDNGILQEQPESPDTPMSVEQNTEEHPPISGPSTSTANANQNGQTSTQSQTGRLPE